MRLDYNDKLLLLEVYCRLSNETNTEQWHNIIAATAKAKARSAIVVRRVAGTMRSTDDAERRRRRDSALATGRCPDI